MDSHYENGIKGINSTVTSVTLTATYTSVCSEEDMDAFLKSQTKKSIMEKNSDLYGCQFLGDVLSRVF